MTPEELQGLCALYVLGALEPQAAGELEARFGAGDPDVVREIQAFRAVVDVLPYTLTPLAPAPAVRAELMARAQPSPAAARPAPQTTLPPGHLRRWRTPLFWLPTAVAALLTLAFGWTVYNLRQHIAGLDARVQQLHEVAAGHDHLLALLTSPAVRIVSLAGTAQAPAASARLLWDTRRGEWTVLAQQLPTLPAGKVYQLWFLTAAGPIPSGTFRLDALQRGMIQAALPAGRSDITGAAVSFEPEGGVAQPTGHIVLAATF